MENHVSAIEQIEGTRMENDGPSADVIHLCRKMFPRLWIVVRALSGSFSSQNRFHTDEIGIVNTDPAVNGNIFVDSGRNVLPPDPGPAAEFAQRLPERKADGLL